MAEVHEHCVVAVSASSLASREGAGPGDDLMGDGVMLRWPLSPPHLPRTSHKTITKRMIIQLIIAGFRWYEAPHMCGIDENDPKRERSQLARCFRLFVILIYI